MSVSALDRPVSNPPPRPLPPKPELKSKDVSPSLVSGQKADRVSFNSSDDKPGKVFAAHASTTKERADGNASQGSSRQSAASDTQPPGFFDKFKQNLKGWCGGQRPPKPDPCPPAPCNAKPPKPPKPCPPERPKPDPCYSKPPERPTPCKPDPCNGKPPERPTPCKPEPCRYERNDELARELLDNFDAFRDSSCRTYITKQDIERVAGQRPTGIEATDKNIRLARALLQRPELIQAIDRHSTTGALNDKIYRREIEMTLGSQSPMKYLDDKQLAQQMFKHFEDLQDCDNPEYISLDKLRRSSPPLSGYPAWIAQEILKRSDTLAALDGGDHWGKDGWIHKDTLRQMAR